MTDEIARLTAQVERLTGERDRARDVAVRLEGEVERLHAWLRGATIPVVETERGDDDE